MKKLYIVFIIAFFVLLLIPICTFTWQERVASEIDNRMLTENPFGQEDLSIEELLSSLEDYVSDRIGLRNQMIRFYLLLNDRLFGEMVHSTYEYGKDGYVFFRANGSVTQPYYYKAFAEMVAEIQNYCDERGVPFVFVFDPAKTTVLSDKLAAGITPDNAWTEEFFALLDEAGVRYVDNTVVMMEKTAEGELVFNKQYNAGHWNDLGAFYGMNAVLEKLQTDFPMLHINSLDEFDSEYEHKDTLMVSEFPIDEDVLYYTAKTSPTDITDSFCDELSIDEYYDTFFYCINEEQRALGSPRTLVFQGSYLNDMGYTFLGNSLGEYIAVHDYQNVLNFEYYFNIFQPECVIFEVAEYTFTDDFFDLEGMKAMELNPQYNAFDGFDEQMKSSDTLSVTAENGQALTVIRLGQLPENTEYAYLQMNETVYDLMSDGEGGYTLTVKNEDYDPENVTVMAVDTANNTKYIYQ